MYDKFYLSSEQKLKIDEFISGKNVLLITGLPGSGKTELAKAIFSKISIHINSSSINCYKNVKEGLLSSIKKKNIMMMFQEKRENREILIDDFDILMKHDKKLFSELLTFLQDGEYYHSKIIVIINPALLKNRKFKKFKKYIHLHLSYNLSSYYKVVKSILNDKKINKTSLEIDQLVYNSNYNLNTIYSLLAYTHISNDINNDTFDSIETIARNILLNDYTMGQVMRLCETNESIVGLNCLENCIQFVRKDDCLRRITRIYDNYVLADIIETNMITNHKWEFRNYLSIFTVYRCHLEREKNKECKLIYNKYISKSLITTNLKNIYIRQTMTENDLLYFYLYLYKNKKISIDEILLKLATVEKKYYKSVIKLFEYLENCKIDKLD